MPLYEVAVLEHPTKKDADDGALEVLVFGPKPVVARDPQTAAFVVIMDNKDTIPGDPTRLEVLVRPFRGDTH